MHVDEVKKPSASSIDTFNLFHRVCLTYNVELKTQQKRE